MCLPEMRQMGGMCEVRGVWSEVSVCTDAVEGKNTGWPLQAGAFVQMGGGGVGREWGGGGRDGRRRLYPKVVRTFDVCSCIAGSQDKEGLVGFEAPISRPLSKVPMVCVPA